MSTGLTYVVALDLEFNQPSKKVIQIGAVMADLANGSIDSGFSCFVNPNEPLDSGVAAMTGISQDVLERAPTIEEAYTQMGDWLKPYELLRSLTPLVWGNGVTAVLCNAVGLKFSDEEWYFSAKPNNIKQFFALKSMHPMVYGFLARFGMETMLVGSLEASVAKFGLAFEGQPNNPMYRAANIFKLYRALIAPPDEERIPDVSPPAL